jgi:NADH:ubiquinone oxidoreductase subunit 6 (subunit J)
VHAALSLVLTLFGVAVHFVSMHAHFLAAVQVIVYAGAIVVLFLFVLMLLGVDKVEDLSIEPFPIQRPLAVVIGVGFAGLVIAAVTRARGTLGESADSLRAAADPRPRQPPRASSPTATCASSPATCSAITCSRSSSRRSS